MNPNNGCSSTAHPETGSSAGCDPVKHGRHKSKSTKCDVQMSVKKIILTTVCVITAVITHSPFVTGLFDKEEVIIAVLHTL